MKVFMSYETVIDKVKSTPKELLDEVAFFLDYLNSKQQKKNTSKDVDYNHIQKINEVYSKSSNKENSACDATKAAMWEQIKNDTW